MSFFWQSNQRKVSIVCRFRRMLLFRWSIWPQRISQVRWLPQTSVCFFVNISAAAALLISGSRDLSVLFILQLNISMNLVTSAGKIWSSRSWENTAISFSVTIRVRSLTVSNMYLHRWVLLTYIFSYIFIYIIHVFYHFCWYK